MGGRGGGPPFRGGRGGNFGGRGGFGNNNNHQNQFYPSENFNPHHQQQGPGPGPGPMPMLNNRMPGPPQMMHRPLGGHGGGGPPGMRPDFHPNMQGGNFGGPPFPNDGPRPPMMRPPFDPPQQPPYGGGGGGPPMNNPYRPHQHPQRMPNDPMNMGPRQRPPFHGPPHPPYAQNSFNQNRMNGPPQQFGGPHQSMPPYQQQPQGPPIMNQGSSMMPGGQGMPPNGMAVGGMAPIMPRKVLINPNFKGGGVEAATSEFISLNLSIVVTYKCLFSRPTNERHFRWRPDDDQAHERRGVVATAGGVYQQEHDAH